MAGLASTPAGRSPWSLAMRRFRKNVRAMTAAALMLLIGAATLAVPWVSPHSFDEPDWGHVQQGPQGKYWFGTDSLGRDLMVRAFLGGRVSFAVGLMGTLVAVAIGFAYGAVSGYAGGRVDLLMMRVVDVLYGLPNILIIIIVMQFFRSKSFLLIFAVIGAISWLTMARIVRGQVLKLREREFVEAARALGATTPSIIVRHMVPNLVGPVIVYATLTVPAVMLTEAFLSFLGLGISEPMTSWGVLISEGARAMSTEGLHWWLIVFPGALFALTLYCLNSVGDGIRDAFDVQQR